MRPKADTYVFAVRGLSKSVKDAFRSVLLRRGRTVLEVTEALMRVYINDPNVIRGWTRVEVMAVEEPPEVDREDVTKTNHVKGIGLVAKAIRAAVYCSEEESESLAEEAIAKVIENHRRRRAKR
jgi:hypothetical protein